MCVVMATQRGGGAIDTPSQLHRSTSRDISHAPLYPSAHTIYSNTHAHEDINSLTNATEALPQRVKLVLSEFSLLRAIIFFSILPKGNNMEELTRVGKFLRAE